MPEDFPYGSQFLVRIDFTISACMSDTGRTNPVAVSPLLSLSPNHMKCSAFYRAGRKGSPVPRKGEI